MNSTRTILSALLFLFLAATGYGQETINKKYPAAANESISISNVAGLVTVNGWSNNEITINGTMSSDLELKVTRSGTHTEIIVKYPNDWGIGSSKNRSADLTLNVPASCNLEVITVSAPIVLDKLTNHVSIESVSGDITVKSTMKNLKIESVSGSVSANGTENHLAIETVSGTVNVKYARNDISIESVSGDITVSGKDYRQVEMEVLSGDLELAGSLGAKANIEINAHSGDVKLRLPANTSAEFELETFSGHISNSLGRSRSDGSGGSGFIEITTFSGDITIAVK